MAVVNRVASFHLVRERRGAVALARLGLDRWRLKRTPGLLFWRLLGTGDGSATGPGADLRRTAMFAVWRDEAALDAYVRAMSPRWSRSVEHYEVRLRAATGHGAWRGTDVIGMLPPPERPASPAPVAIITRADVRMRSWRAFRRAGGPVSDELAGADGLLAVVGIGEAPIGRLGTFSLWRDVAAARTFASSQPHHREVVRRTRAERWYGEELFARFEPYASSGSWDGRDPLRDSRDPRLDITGTSIP